MKEATLEIPWPLKGIDAASSFESKPGGTTPSAVNCRAYDPLYGMNRGGQRSGHTKYMSSQLNGSLAVQNIDHVTTTIGVPVAHPGDMVVPLSSGGSFKLFDSTGAATGTAGTATDTMTCACWDTSGNCYVGVLTAASALVVYKVNRAGTVAWGPITVAAASVGAAPAGIFGICWDGANFIYALGSGASLSPVLRIWKLATSTGAISGGTYLTSETSAAGLRGQGSAQPSLNVLAYCAGYLLYPSAAHVVTLYNISTAVKTTIDLGDTKFGTCFTDIASDGGGYFYVLGYKVTTPVSGLAKISVTGTTAFSIQQSTVMYSMAYNPAISQLTFCNTTTYATASLLTGAFIASITITGNTTWAVVRNSSVSGGSDVYARDTTSNFAQISTALVITTAATTLVGNNINAGVGTNQQAAPTTVSLANIRILAVAGGYVQRVTTAGPVTITNGQVFSSGATVVASAPLFNNIYYSDGLQYVYYSGALDAMVALTATAGSLPKDGANNTARLMVAWRQRLVVAGFPLDPCNWYMSAVGDPTNWQTLLSATLQTQAVSGNDSQAGKARDVINCMISYNNDLLLFGLDHSLYQMTGDPMAGGRLDEISDEIGIAFGQPWCRDGTGTLYFVSSRGSIYRYAPGALPEKISSSIAELLEGVIDFSNTIVRMAWDERQTGFMVYISPVAGGATFNYFYDVRNGGGWWKDTFATSTQQPFAVHELQGFTAGDRVILLGGQDGYIRYMDPTATTDDGVNIASNIYLGPLKGKTGDAAYITDLQCALGANAGNVTWTLYAGRNAEHAFNTASAFSGTFSAGRNRSQPVRCEASAFFLKLANSASTTWQYEYCKAVVRVPLGKTRSRAFT